MRAFAARPLRAGRYAFRLLRSRLRGHEICQACGFRGRLDSRRVLWPELIAEWGLSPDWATWFDQREGTKCVRCGCNLRSGQLAQAIVVAIGERTGAPRVPLRRLFDDPRSRTIRIAEINSAGDLHPFLARSPQLCYSEYGGRVAGVRSENLLSLSYADSTFDLAITSETLEHVPDVEVALAEIYRVLKPGGAHIFTVPVVWDQPVTRSRAALRDGEVVHLLPPSYHGSRNHAQHRTDLLVFYEFGADCIELCTRVGFETQVIRDPHNPALCVFVARRPALAERSRR